MMTAIKILLRIAVTACSIIAVAVFLLSQAWVPMIVAALVGMFAPSILFPLASGPSNTGNLRRTYTEQEVAEILAFERGRQAGRAESDGPMDRAYLN
jgi:hypothetical protein